MTINPEQVSDEAARRFLDYLSRFGQVVTLDEEAALTWAKREIAALAERTSMPGDFEKAADLLRGLG